MGFFNSLKAGIGKTIGTFGNVVRKVADFGGGVARKVGQFAGPVSNAAAGIADMLGQGGVADGIRGVGSALQYFSPEAEKILSKASGVGRIAQGIGKVMK